MYFGAEITEFYKALNPPNSPILLDLSHIHCIKLPNLLILLANGLREGLPDVQLKRRVVCEGGENGL